MPYSLVLERASGTHNYSVQRKVEPTHLRVLCSVPVSQAHSNKFRLAALEALCFISLWCLGAQRKGMVIIMENKYKHMDYIQSAISRMASNSFYLKGWNVTIIAAIVALSFKESDWRIYACALVLNVVFWFLDAYYLKQEKLFRELYNKVSKISDDNLVDFSMNTSEFKEKVSAIPCLMIKNISITPLYLSISVVLLVLIHIV